MPEDPNLTPFMNSARAKFGYGTVPTVPPEVTSTVYVPPTTASRRPTTTTSTTESPTESFGIKESFGISPGEDSGFVGTGDSGIIDTGDSGIVGNGDSGVAPPESGDSGAGFGFGPSELPPEFQNVGFGLGGGDNGFNFNVPADKMDEKKETTTASPTTTEAPTTPKPKRMVQRFVLLFNISNWNISSQKTAECRHWQRCCDSTEFRSQTCCSAKGVCRIWRIRKWEIEHWDNFHKNFLGGSGGGFGGGGGGFGGGGGGFGSGSGLGGAAPAPPAPAGPDPDFGGDTGAAGPSEGDYFTGESALTRSKGPTGDGYGPPIFPGGAVPPPVPAVNLGGAAAGKSPYSGQAVDVTENPVTTVKPSALLSVLSKADMGFNQAIDHFEHGTPVETAAIDILEVALGSQKLDSQAKLLGHVDRTIGLDNLQRLQRWANTAGAMDVFKDQVREKHKVSVQMNNLQFLKFAKNFQPPADLLPTVPPQLEYLFKTSGK